MLLGLRLLGMADDTVCDEIYSLRSGPKLNKHIYTERGMPVVSVLQPCILGLFCTIKPLNQNFKSKLVWEFMIQYPNSNNPTITNCENLGYVLTFMYFRNL